MPKYKKKMKVLIACEFSGIVRDAFRRVGHDAISCDLVKSESWNMWHHKGDIIKLLKRNASRWDMMIAFPPCTHLAVSGARWFKDKEKEQQKAIDFFMTLVNAEIPKICIENPVGIMSTVYRKPDQYIQPWQFGHGETKKTGLWLKGLSLLIPTDNVEGREPRIHHMTPGPDRARERSRFYPGIAEAMANQWS